MTTMTTTITEVKKRNRERRRGGFTKAEVQRLAGVSVRFIYLWYRGERTSAKVKAAHDTLYAAAMATSQMVANGTPRKGA